MSDINVIRIPERLVLRYFATGETFRSLRQSISIIVFQVSKAIIFNMKITFRYLKMKMHGLKLLQNFNVDGTSSIP